MTPSWSHGAEPDDPAAEDGGSSASCDVGAGSVSWPGGGPGIRNTFRHLPGIGAKTENRLWRDGLLTWEDFLSAGRIHGVSETERALLNGRLEECRRRYEAGDWYFFDKELPLEARWRAFRDLGARPVYFDIETTGDWRNEITVLGLYDGREYRAFLKGGDWRPAVDLLQGATLLVSYNGAKFDLPAIRSQMRFLFLNAVHVDLDFPLRWIGLRGGLKRVEEQAGIDRTVDTRHLSGFDAVRLWKEYKAGSEGALRVLLEYNRQDACHLEPLMKLAYERLSALPRL